MTYRVILVACLLVAPAAGQDSPQYGATFVAMKVPDKVTAWQVFPVTISMRNTGMKAWEGPDIRLRSIDPRDNSHWGTSYILIAQGTTVQPGQEYAFRSYLRAPAKPGKVSFRWQIRKDENAWFGDSTPTRTIEVAPPAAEATEASVPARPAAGDKKVLTFEDFEYEGSFKPPQTVGEARGAFSDAGLALRPLPGGGQRMLMNYTHPEQVLFEIEIPKLAKVTDGRHAHLAAAEVKKVWGPLSLSKSGEEPISPNGGMLWLQESRTLVWTWYHGYKTGEAPPVLGATTLGEDGRATSRGPWYVKAPDDLYKSYWGGVVRLSQSFAEKYTGGRRLALGFGGYYSICGPASRGPALGTIGDPDPKQATLDVTAMLYHRHDSPAVRDGDYFNANCDFWSEQPDGPRRGAWSYDDWCRAGAFIDTPAAHGYIAFVRLGTGRLGYDFGTITSAGSSEYWYVYDPHQLGQAALGRTKPWQVAPASTTRVQYPLGRTVTGACFDDRTGRLYLCVSWAYPEGMESFPVVHVYRLRSEGRDQGGTRDEGRGKRE